MSAPSTRDVLVKVLTEHSETYQSDGDYGEYQWIECSCDQDDEYDDKDGWRTGYVKHLADVLAAALAERGAQ